MTLNGEMPVMMHYFFIILNYGRAVLLATAELLVRNLHTAVERILSISSAFLLMCAHRTKGRVDCRVNDISSYRFASFGQKK